MSKLYLYAPAQPQDAVRQAGDNVRVMEAAARKLHLSWLTEKKIAEAVRRRVGHGQLQAYTDAWCDQLRRHSLGALWAETMLLDPSPAEFRPEMLHIQELARVLNIGGRKWELWHTPRCVSKLHKYRVTTNVEGSGVDLMIVAPERSDAIGIAALQHRRRLGALPRRQQIAVEDYTLDGQPGCAWVEETADEERGA